MFGEITTHSDADAVRRTRSADNNICLTTLFI